MSKSLSLVVTCMMLGVVPLPAQADQGAATSPPSAQKLDAARAQATLMLEGGRAGDAVILLSKLSWDGPPLEIEDDAALSAARDAYHLLLGDALVAMKFADLAMWQYFDVVWQRDVGEESVQRQGQALAKMAQGMPKLTEISKRFWLWQLGRIHIDSAARKLLPADAEWILAGDDGSRPMPSASPEEKLWHQQAARIRDARALIYKGIRNDDGDDFRRIDQLIVISTQELQDGLNLLTREEWTDDHREEVAKLLAYGYIYLKKSQEGAAALEALAKQGDAGGTIRFRAALLRAEPACMEPTCARLPAYDPLFFLSELVYRSFCGGDSSAKIVAALADAEALLEELRATLHWVEDESRYQEDIRLETWPPTKDRRTRDFVRRLAFSAKTHRTLAYLESIEAMLRESSQGEAGWQDSPLGLAIGREFTKVRERVHQEAHLQVRRNLREATRPFLKLVIDELRPRARKRIGIRDITLQLDDSVCPAYRLAPLVQKPPAAQKPRGCGGCAIGEIGAWQSSGWPALILLLAVRRRWH